jgi:EAL domain-containing protein (putative c-di-GMP-specific phosphodiesterase class I)
MEDSPQEVLRRADTALHRAKAAGGNQSAFFDVSHGRVDAAALSDRKRLAQRHCCRTNCGCSYSRQVDASGKLVSGEVLVRWQHPERGLLPPGAFIPIAEESDLIIELENWVTRETCRLLAREELDGRPLHVVGQYQSAPFPPEGFVNWLIDLMQQEGCDPAYLTLGNHRRHGD